MPNLGTRDDWRKTKEKYGIPDAVCKFSMGEKLGAFAKAEAAAKDDINTRAGLWEGMVQTLTTYEKALSAMKPEKFKGKTPSEKQANANKAKQELKDMLQRATDMTGLVKMQQQPLKHVKTYLAPTATAFKSLNTTQSAAVEKFYRQDLRNNLGLAIKTALKDGLRPDIKTAFTEFETHMTEIDAAFNHAKAGQTPDLNAICTAMRKSIAALEKVDI